MERFEAAAEGDGRVGAPDPHDGSVEVGEGPLADDGGDLPAEAAGQRGLVEDQCPRERRSITSTSPAPLSARIPAVSSAQQTPIP